MAKRIEFDSPGGIDVLHFRDFTPVDPAPNDVQVENKAIGVNYIDTYFRSGLYPAPTSPSGLGSEAAGVVVKIGSAVRNIKVGDRVVYAQSPLGAYSEIHNVAEEKLAILPDGISFEIAAASFMKGLTAFYLLRKTHDLKAGEIFLFHAAAGGVGQIACQWAKALGAKMIGTVGSDEKAKIAKASGAWETINYTTENIVERVLALTDGEKVSVVYDSVGKDTWLASLDCLKRRGLMVSYGNASGPVTGVDLGILNKKGSLFVTRPSVFGYITDREELKEASDEIFGLILSGQLNITLPADQIYPLKDAKLAHQRLENRATCGSSILIP